MVWPVGRKYFGALGAKTVQYCDRLERLHVIAMRLLLHLGYVTGKLKMNFFFGSRKRH